MQVNKVAILIDGGFFTQRYRKQNEGKYPKKQDVEKIIKDIMVKLKALNDDNTACILYRSFYYDCEPYGGTKTSHDGSKEIDFSAHPGYTAANRYLDSLKYIDQFALRLGEISFSGWKIRANHNEDEVEDDNGNDNEFHYIPDFKQKGVDMKIGLDMAWMAGKRTVQKMVLVTGDSDFVSPIKHVRREGIMVYLYPMGFGRLKGILKEHCDFIIG